MIRLDPRLLNDLRSGDRDAFARALQTARRRDALPVLLEHIAEDPTLQLAEPLFEGLLSPPRPTELASLVRLLLESWSDRLPAEPHRTALLLALAPTPALFDLIRERMVDPATRAEAEALQTPVVFERWRDHLELGDALLLAMMSVFEGALCQGTPYDSRYFHRGYYTLTHQGGIAAWRALLASRASEPTTAWLAAEMAVYMETSGGKSVHYLPYYDHLLGEPLGERAIAPVVHLTLLRAPRAREERKRLVEIVARLPECPPRAAYVHLQDIMSTSKPIREHARHALSQIGDAAVASALPLLEQASVDSRLEIARLAESHPHRNALPHLKAQRKRDRSPRVRAVLDRAIAAAELLPPALDEALDDEALDALLAANPSLDRPAFLRRSKLPDLHYTSGLVLSTRAQSWLVSQLLREGPESSDGLRSVTERIVPEDRAALLDVLWLAWDARPDPKMRKGFLYAHALLANSAQLRRLVREHILDSEHHAWATHAIRVLGRAATPTAITLLDQLASTLRHALAKHAQSVLHELARRAGLSLPSLLERNLDTYGLEDAGRPLRYGDKIWHLRVGQGGTLLFCRGDKATDRMPTTRGLPPRDAEAITGEVKTWRRRVAKAYAHQSARIERKLGNLEPWPVEIWQKLFLDHPITRTMTPHLLFARAPFSMAQVAFSWRPEASALHTLDGARVELDTLDALCLVHPIYLTDGLRQRWLERLDPQPWPQLERDIYPHTEEFHRKLMDRLQHSFWHRAMAEEGFEWEQSSVKRSFGDIAVRVSFAYPRTDPPLQITRQGRPLPPEIVPPHVYSEMARALLRAAEATP